jgi:ABC-2 type transport system ATP-binding protein
MIEVERLSKFYAGKAAIKDVSFRISQGEIVGLLGLNGAGKSTILKILGSYLTPSGGKATVNGIDVAKHPDEVRKIIGFLPEVPPLYNEMTVFGYLQYVARLKLVPEADVMKRVAEAAERTNLTEVMNARLGELSHGFRQRAGIAQAIVHKPQVLIFDEPINGLDPVQIVEMRDLIKSLKGDHTLVLSSHILSEITRTCDRMIIMDHGTLVAEGSEANLAKKMTEQMRVLLTLDRLNDDLTRRLRAIEAVITVDSTDGFEGHKLLTVTTKRDVRPDLARAVIDSGAGLVGMQREGGGLEGLFMQLINSSSDKNGRNA